LLSQPPIPLNSAKAGLRFSGAVEDVIMKALSKEPAKRYPSTVAFAEALCAAIGAPVEEDSPGFMGRLKQLFARES